MAKIKVASTEYSGLMNIKFMVNIDIESKEIFNQMINSGFDPELWENKNNQKVLVTGKHYTEI